MIEFIPVGKVETISKTMADVSRSFFSIAKPKAVIDWDSATGTGIVVGSTRVTLKRQSFRSSLAPKLGPHQERSCPRRIHRLPEGREA